MKRVLLLVLGAAFAALPAGTVEALLGDIPALNDILLYADPGDNGRFDTIPWGFDETWNGAFTWTAVAAGSNVIGSRQLFRLKLVQR